MNKINTELFLYKYQPKYFIDFEIKEELIYFLNIFIDNNNLNILFIGNNCVGKTSLINACINEYYKGYKHYNNNILIINNIKEQGINYYRNDVKTFCQTTTEIKGKKKIIILDDIDNINEQSQQVFRNYIDNYSHNISFISSCTNPQKVIQSLQSRLFIIKLQPLNKINIINIINKIIIKENIDITNDAIEHIVNISNNNINIIINYMEKIKLLNEKITLDTVINICTNINYKLFDNYICFLKKKETINAIKILYDIYDKGYSVMDILDTFFIYIKTTNNLTEDIKYIIIPFICKYITIFHNIHENEVELALLTNNLQKIIP